MRPFSDALRQRGSGTLEALIGVGLTAIIGSGTLHVAARMSESQRDLRVQGIAISQLRNLLNESGSALCGSTGKAVALPNGSNVAVKSFTCSTNPKIKFQPSINDAGAPLFLEVDAVRSVTAAVGLTDLGLKADTANAVVEVGTRL